VLVEKLCVQTDHSHVGTLALGGPSQPVSVVTCECSNGVTQAGDRLPLQIYMITSFLPVSGVNFEG
jgi:hypothetical protein